MVGVMNIKRCGTCRFAKIMSNDLSKRMCWGAPPVPQEIRQGNNVTYRMVRPIVHVSEDACALHAVKEAADVVRDAEAMQALHAMQQAPDTRQ